MRTSHLWAAIQRHSRMEIRVALGSLIAIGSLFFEHVAMAAAGQFISGRVFARFWRTSAFAAMALMIPPGRPICGSIRRLAFAPPSPEETLSVARRGSGELGRRGHANAAPRLR